MGILYSVYARPNDKGIITHIFSSCFEKPTEADILIKSGQGNDYVHVFGGGVK